MRAQIMWDTCGSGSAVSPLCGRGVRYRETETHWGSDGWAAGVRWWRRRSRVVSIVSQGHSSDRERSCAGD